MTLYNVVGAFAALAASQVSGMDLPSVPTKYMTTIEANIANKGYTFVLNEWYDAAEQRARRTFHSGDQIFTFLEDYSSETDAVWLFAQDAGDLDNVLYCTLESYSNKTNSFRWSRFLTVFGQWLQGDGAMDGAVYEGQVGDVDDDGSECGDYNMRGIRANKWTKQESSSYDYTNYSTSVDYNVSYFWTAANWTYAFLDANESDIPLRIEIIGTHNTTYKDGIQNVYDFYHSYEYVEFLRGEDVFDSDDVLDFYLNVPEWVDECDTSHYCSFYPDSEICSDSQGPQFPDIPEQFQVTIEANDKTNDISYLMEEFYDYPNDRVKFVFYYGNDSLAFHQLQLDSVSQQWLWIGGDDQDESGTCWMNLVSDFTGIDLLVPEVNGHIAKPSKWFHIDSEKTWLGYTMVRQHVPAEKWKASWNESWVDASQSFYLSINATNYFYFNRPEWKFMYSNDESVVPIRMELEGFYDIYNLTSEDGSLEGMKYMDRIELDISYDMVGFVAGEIDDSKFEVPTYWRERCDIDTEYCEDDRYSESNFCNEPDLPTLPDAFEATVEAVFVTKNFSMVVDEFYDFANNRERVITYPHTYKSTLFGFSVTTASSTHMLEDGDLFWTWKQTNGGAMDSEGATIEDCELSLISQASGHGVSTFFDTTTSHVSTTKTLFDWVANASVETYIGTDYVNGFLCNQWKHKVETRESQFESYGVTYSYASNVTVIYSFMSDEFKSTDIYGEYGVPVRADVSGHTIVSSDTGFYSEHDFEHYYNYIKFSPSVSDEIWFEPPFGDEVTCNITRYCIAAENFNGESGSHEGASSEEYEEWCDEADDGMITLEDDSSEEDSDESDESHEVEDEVEMTSGGLAALIICLLLVCVATGVGGFYYGTYKQKQKAPMVRLD